MKTADDLMKGKPKGLISVSPESTVQEALRIMVERNIGAILVEKDGEILGIWSERDFMRNSLQAGFDITAARVGDYMTTALHSAPRDTPLIKLQEMFLGLFIRHVLLEKDEQLRELNTMASWEYYENWKWKGGSET
jgi:CBS domain-containing protein